MKPVVAHYKTGNYLHFTETWIYWQIQNLRAYDSVVYCHAVENADIYPTDRVRVLGLPGDRLWPVKAWNKWIGRRTACERALRADKPSVVHAHFGYSGYYFLPHKKKRRLPLVTTYYGSDLTKHVKSDARWVDRYRRLFEAGDRFLLEGPHMRRKLIELGCPAEKAQVQHLGIETEKIPFVPRRLAPGEPVKIFMSASFKEKKGIPYAVEAFGRVKRLHPKQPLQLTLLGDASRAPGESSEKRKILDKIDEWKLRDSVTLLGYQPYPVFFQELYKHHLFLSPSVEAQNGDTEGGSPVSITEAAASGMPVLSTTHCDIPEVVLQGKTGYLTPERDAEALAAALEKLILRPEDWEAMGRAARVHVEQEYDVRKQARRLESVYDDVVRRAA